MASHIFRLLAGGAQGKAQRRSRRERNRPLRCAGCPCTDNRVCWRSPTRCAAGVAWCPDCRPGAATDLWE
eukprot:9293053-Lingulodinium_polyedra.AAC.1